MSIAITNTPSHIVFTEGDVIHKTLKTNINDFVLKRLRGYMLLITDTPSGHLSRRKIKYSDVSTPNTVDITALYNLLSDYLTVNTGANHVFVATASQTDFDCSPYFSLNDDYKVFVDGIYTSFGHSRSGNTVVFTVGQTVGTEVMVMI